MALKGRIAVFKSLAVSNGINLLLKVKVFNYTIDILYKIQKNFILQGKIKNPNIVLLAIDTKRRVKKFLLQK